MKKKTLRVYIEHLPSKPFNYRYVVRITYVEGMMSFINDNKGQGWTLSDAEHYAYAIRDCLKPEVLET